MGITGKQYILAAGADLSDISRLGSKDDARLIAQHMGKHIPGNPTFVVQNMTGAGSIIGANYLYNISKPDGLTIGAIQPSIFFNQLMNQKEVKFEWGKFTWIGRVG